MSCSATGTPPIYTVMIRNSTIMANTTTTAARNTTTTTVILREEGNYTCVATNRYGTDVGEISVIFTGKNKVPFFISDTGVLGTAPA